MADNAHVLATGREVRLVRFYADCTYAGVLEGSTLTATPHLLSHVHDVVRRVLPPGRPLLVVKPDGPELPSYRLMAELESRRGVRQGDPDWASRLFVCWFVENLGDADIDTLVRSVLPALDWEARAEDFDITLF